MNRSAKTWLLFMMVPFFIGVLIHFLVPLQIIISTNPKLEETFNGYKIEVEQNTVRALAFLNSRVLTHRIQTYENLRSTFVRLLYRKDISENKNISQYVLNRATDVALNWTGEPEDLRRSMWYSPNFSNIDAIYQNKDAKFIYENCVKVEPFIRSVFNSKEEIYDALVRLEATVQLNSYQFYFQFPSEKNSLFENENANIIRKSYTLSHENKEKQNFTMTILDEGSWMKICTVVSMEIENEGSSSNDKLNGVVCMGLDISNILKDIQSSVEIPQFELSFNTYYLLRPLYIAEELDNPQILAYFSNNGEKEIPIDMFFDLSTNKLSKAIFNGESTYNVNIQRHERTNTYYTLPINLFHDSDSISQVGMYLVVENNFAKAELAEESRNERISIIMIVPSVLLMLISILATSLIMRAILKKLDKALTLMGDYCSFIKRGDLELEIPEYKGTEDLKELFIQLSKLNELNKYSDSQYFNVPKPERMIRLLKCLKLFDELNYDKTNLYENIGECYIETGELINAIKFLKLSVEMSIEELYGNENLVDKYYEAKIKKELRMDKSWRKKEKSLRRKVFSLCRILFYEYRAGNKEVEGELVKKTELLRKISYPDILNFEYIACQLFIISCHIKMKKLNGIEAKMEIVNDLIQAFADYNHKNPTCEIPIEIVHSFWLVTKGEFKISEKKYGEAFECFVECLHGNRYHPMTHARAHSHMKEILELSGLSIREMKDFKYLKQYTSREDREYIFLVDVGKPKMNISEVNDWKRLGRKMVDFIFTKLVQLNDRISITEYCLDIKVICNLIEKANRESIIRKELMNSIKARDQNITALLLPCLRKSIQRVKCLKKEKIFIVLYKGGSEIDCSDIMGEIEEIENSKFLFFTQDKSIFKSKDENIFVLDINDETSAERILGEKTWKPADNVVSIL